MSSLLGHDFASFFVTCFISRLAISLHISLPALLLKLSMSRSSRRHGYSNRVRMDGHNRTCRRRRAANARARARNTRCYTTRPVLIQRRSIQHSIIVTSHKVVRQMRAIVESQPAPPVRRVLSVRSVGIEGPAQHIESIIVTCSSVGDVPGVARVVETSRVALVVVQRLVSLVGVDVAGEDEVDGVVVEDGLEDIFALCADCGGLVLVGDVPWAVCEWSACCR